LVSYIFFVMTRDALLTSHPVSAEIRDPDDITLYFDAISYDKVRIYISCVLIIINRHGSAYFTLPYSVNTFIRQYQQTVKVESSSSNTMKIKFKKY